MLISSLTFMLIFPAVTLLYYIVPVKFKNIYLLLFSYFVYLCSGPVYALFILFSTLITWVCGKALGKVEGNARKVVLVVTVLLNLFVLVFFKYFSFFSLETLEFLSQIGLKYNASTLKLLAPLGISYYTFQTIGYIADVYKKKVVPEQSFPVYALFVSFFPQVAMGPIGRADSLLPQFHESHAFDYGKVTDGLRQMALGFFKKFAVADLLAVFVNEVYGADLRSYTGLVLIFAMLAFTIQLYCDFSGYSDIAIGCARVLGFDLMENFKTPLFATSITSFWNRWHISLSSWFKDYIYIPLGGSRKGILRYFLNLSVVFLVSGIWHGDTINFVIWGALHAAFRVLEACVQLLIGKQTKTRTLPVRIVQNIVTFSLVSFSFIFFKASSLSDALYIVTHLFRNMSVSSFPAALVAMVQKGFRSETLLIYGFLAFCFMNIVLLFAMDWYKCFKLNNGSLPHAIGSWKPALRWVCYYGLIAIIFAAFLMQSGGFDAPSFIYLQY